MADIAQRVGVSKMTVSRALARTTENDRAPSEQLRQRILAACAEMGYVIDQTARTFASKRSGVVAAVIPSLNNSNFSETAQGITSALAARGLQLLLAYDEYREEDEERLLRSLLMHRPEGVILTGGHHSAGTRAMLQAAGIPVVETWELPAQPIEHVVGFSNAQAGAALLRHLHAQGYRRIGFIGGSSERDHRGSQRREGVVQAMQALGLPAQRVLAFGEPPLHIGHGGQAVLQLLQQWPDTDAVICVSDLLAFGALTECQRRGWAVPGRLAIAGFGDFEIARHCHPRLTTVALDCQGIGRSAGELLLQAIDAAREGNRLPAQTITAPFHVVQRESS
ncbi:LacI family DNA-binding transcriptional regulator [Aquincola sp. J276]|uniref:LacI family DNA-binding transcriptional regulator n=1 Tax=Aquincola sp. J276 TaxID=2898432 RepID=UPI002151DB9F|nr:LacI family DNA-binding transcriptional regulator [Aquincola sp. J276]MCR5868365.1 LacI family DNA-binding transcriptional regulator [Aquincola sp. J276]